MLLSETIQVKWNNVNKNYFENLDYKYSKNGDLFTVKISDLHHGSKIKIDLICDICEIKYNLHFCGYTRGKDFKEKGLGYYTCNKCSNQRNLKSHDQYVEEVYNLVGDEYTIVSTYKKSDEKISILHNKCGYIFEYFPSCFLAKPNTCLLCSGLMQKDTDTFKKNVFDLVGEKYVVEGEYKNSKTKIAIKHILCGTTYHTKPDTFLKGCRCPICFGNTLKTTKIFKDIVLELEGDNYTVLGEYISSNIKIKIRHNICNSEYEVTPDRFTNRGQRCPKCNGGIKNKDTEIFKKEVFELVGNEYEVLGEYEGTNTLIMMKHSICDFEWEIRPHQFLHSGTRCLKCSGFMKKTTESFSEEMFNLVGTEYSVLGDYKNSNTKIKIIHNTCNNIFDMMPSSFLNDQRCPKCFGKPLKTLEQFKSEVYDIVGDEYTITGEYKNSKTKIEIIHNVCNFVFESKPNNFLQGSRCPLCAGCFLKTTDKFKSEVYDIVKDEYNVVGDYTGSLKKIEMKHNICGYIYEVQASNFLSGQRCPQCSESKGEQKIRIFLTNNGINFQREFVFSDCKYKNLLPFDFAILDNFQNPIFIIEYDGQQHFEAVDFFGGDKAFRSLIKRDKIKTNYCIANNIPLLRIPYWDFEHVEEILTFALIKLNIEVAI